MVKLPSVGVVPPLLIVGVHGLVFLWLRMRKPTANSEADPVAIDRPKPLNFGHTTRSPLAPYDCLGACGGAQFSYLESFPLPLLFFGRATEIGPR